MPANMAMYNNNGNNHKRVSKCHVQDVDVTVETFNAILQDPQA